MSAYVGKFITSISSALDFNTATLSGAIDIVVIQDDDGNRSCSPFHVRFGKLQLLKSRGIPVLVELNGVRTNLRMLLGAAGEAYFYNAPNVGASVKPSHHHHLFLPSASTADIQAPPAPSTTFAFVNSSPPPAHANSAIDIHLPPVFQPSIAPSNTASESVFAYMSDSEVELTRAERDGTNEVVDEPRSPPLNSSQRKWTTVLAQNDPSTSHRTHTLQPPPLNTPTVSSNSTSSADFSSSLFDLPASPSPSSRRRRSIDKTKLEESTSPRRLQFDLPEPGHDDDSQLDVRSVDGFQIETPIHLLNERIAGALAEREAKQHSNDEQNGDDVADPSVKLPTSLELSLCGPLINPDMTEEHISELFNRHCITREDFLERPSILNDPDLVVRIDNRLVSFRVAASYLLSLLAFNTSVDFDVLAGTDKPETKDEPEKVSSTPSRRFRWFGWSSSTVVGEPLLSDDEAAVLDERQVKAEANARELLQADVSSNIEVGAPASEPRSQENAVSAVAKALPSQAKADNQDTEPPAVAAVEEKKPDQMEVSDSNQFQPEPLISNEDSEKLAELEAQQHNISFSDIDPELLSLRPTHEQLQELDLQPGANTVRFIVEQSEAEVNCRIFLWSCHNKIVISDVDGTITRSDVLGHLLPAVGRDWSQAGVAKLYSLIERNGYKILYLTARPIGQASQTRGLLHSVTQGGARLPNGPVLMSPNRLVESFTREVIRKKPQEFKISCLHEIRSMFSPTYNPFHAGFGNRETDVISYRAVGLIPQRIFVVNPRGELVVMKSSYESAASYHTLQNLVEGVFPDITGHVGQERVRVAERATFNDWNYWKPTLPDIDLESLGIE